MIPDQWSTEKDCRRARNMWVTTLNLESADSKEWSQLWDEGFEKIATPRWFWYEDSLGRAPLFLLLGMEF